MITDLLQAFLPGLLLYAIPLITPAVCLLLALRRREKPSSYFFGFVLAAIGSLAACIWISYDMYMSSDAQAALGILVMPIFSLLAGITSFFLYYCYRFFHPVQKKFKPDPLMWKIPLLFTGILLIGFTLFQLREAYNGSLANLAWSTRSEILIRHLATKAQNENNQVLMVALSRNPHTPTYILENMLTFVPHTIGESVLKHPNATDEMRINFYER
jgi:hypothetical protein